MTLHALDDELEFARFTRRVGEGLAESSLRLAGMHCAACALTIEDALLRVTGVSSARVSAAAQRVAVRWDPRRTRPSALVAAVEAAGYGAVPDTAAEARAQRQRESRAALWRLFVAAFCAMQVMMMAAPAYWADGDLAPDLKRLLDWGSWLLTLPVLLFSAAPFFTGALRSLRTRRMGMDVPVALGIAVAFIASSGAAFEPGGVFGHEVYFDSLTMFVSFLLAGRWLELRARHAAVESLEAAAGRLPQTVQRELANGDVERISALRLAPGDIVRVPRGEAFAADGVLLAGASTSADESLLNGESRPRPKAPGDVVIAGSLNLGAPVRMRVERTGADTRFEAIVALMREAQTQRPSSVRTADRWAAPFLWAVLLLAAGAAAVWSVVDPSRAVWVAVSVLIVTCPCALSLAAPSAWLAGAAALGRHGVLLRRANALEDLAAMQTLFIDKTGTLTQPDAVRLTPLAESWPDKALWAKAVSLARWSSHPLAAALAARPGDDNEAWTGLEEVPGNGVRGVDAEGAVWRLGKGEGEGVWLFRSDAPLATFSIDETLRPGAAEAVQALREEGVRIVLLSGDAPARVQRLAEHLHLDAWHGGATPEDKLTHLRAAQVRGERVAMIGDGINDAPVLAQADVSLAMGEGAQIARLQADGVLLAGRLSDLLRARALARETVRVVRQNIAWAALYNAACVPLALLGWLPPWAAGLGMALSSLFVVLNALRLSRR